MDYSIEVRESYLYIKIGGKISLIGPSGWEEIKSVLGDIVDTIKQKKIYKLLVDGRDFTGKVTTIDRFLVAVFLVKENAKLMRENVPPLEIAMVGNKSLVDPKRFGQTVARNRGLDGLVTDNMREAFKWLKLDPPDDI